MKTINYCTNLIVAATLCTSFAFVAGAQQVAKPNVLIILIDDAGYADFGFMSKTDLLTPEIDKLAANGMRCSDAHVTASVCAPSRAGLMTGLYQQRFGFEANGTGDSHTDFGLSDSVTTMADAFAANGYRTFALGKWHLGGSPSDNPNKRGFHEFFGFLAGSRSYFKIDKPTSENRLQHNGVSAENFSGYLTDVLGDKAVAYMKETTQPFFMYLAFNAVHTPMQATQEDLQKFEGHPRQKLAAMTWALDRNVGKITAHLRKTGQLSNTLIFFLSDNGGAHDNQSSVGGWKGWKGNEFEGGHRVPFVLSWPQRIKSGAYDGLVSSLDIFPTALAAAGIQAKAQYKLDGVDLLPYVSGKMSSTPHQSLYWRKLDKFAIRSGHYKIVGVSGKDTAFYNLQYDPGEKNNLIVEHRDTQSRLLKDFAFWQSQMMQPLWREGKDWMDVCTYIHLNLIKNLPVLYKHPSAQFKQHQQQEETLQ